MAVQLTDADVLAALKSKLGHAEPQVESWRQTSLMEDGRLGYLGDHFKLEATVRRPGDAEASDVTLFVKALPKNPTARETCTKSGLFKKEALFYKLLSADMIAAMRQERPGFQPFVFPECHHIRDDCMLLDDLGRFGFTGIEGRECMPIEHARLVVKALGELHAAGLVLEERAGGRTLIEQFPELNFESFFNNTNDATAGWHRASINLCVAIVPHLDKYKGDSAAIAKAQAALPGLLRTLFDSLGAWPGVRNTFCHGDVWINNFMFRSDASGAPVEVSLVDFQLARYTPPAHDLIMFITFCTDKAFQERYLAELTRLHWDSMAAALRRAGCDPDKVLPWSEFQDVAAKEWKYGLLQMALEQPFSLAPSSLMNPLLEDEKKFYHHCHVDRTDTIINLYKQDAYFHSRYNETMEQIIDNYILKE